MRKIIPLFILLVIVIIFFKQFFFSGLLPIPSDTLIGLYNPFRDLYAQEYPRGIPFKNFLITDPIRQQYPWKELAISMEKNFQVPLWNPYAFSGYPLLANFQGGALYPLNAFFFILPFSYAWSLLIFLQPLLAGIFLYWYLRNLKLQPLASLLGAFAFAFSGFSIAWLEWGTIMQTLLWVPLILLAKDKLLKNWSLQWTLVFFFAEIAAFFAGHLQILFYSLCITNAYLLLRVWQKASQDKKNKIGAYIKIYLPFLLLGFVMYAITAIQWISTLQFILLSGRSIDQNYLTTAGWFVPYQHLLQFFAPDFFGNPTTLNYWGVWNYGELIGYIGIVPLLFALFALLVRRDKKTYFFGLLGGIAFLFALPSPIAQIPYRLHIPFLSTSQPTRLMGVIDFALAILAALGFDYYLKQKNRKLSILTILFCIGFIFIGMWVFVLEPQLSQVAVANVLVTKHNLVFPSIIFVSTLVIILLSILSRKYLLQKIQLILACVLLLVTILDLLRFANKFDSFTSQKYLYPTTKSIHFLQSHIGNYRFMTTDSRILPPNVSSIYKLQSIEGYDPLYIQNYGAFIAAISRKKPDISTPYGFNRIITPHDIQNPFINILGVKYILSLVDLSDPTYRKVFQEGETKIYENTHVLPRAFFVDTIISSSTPQDTINKVFSYETNLSHIAIVENISPFSSAIGSVDILSYSPNKIFIKTRNKMTGFLVLTDVYYPSWHAYIDGRETKIYKTDFTFRGIQVNAGEHTIVFSDHLF